VAEKRYYWLKLKRDFFKRHDVRIIEAMPNGKDYVLFYLKLLLESIDHEGALRFSETIPYNEDMLSVITNINIDVVRAAMKLFMELKMIEVFDDRTIFMNEVQALIGSETKWAEKKRKLRSKEDNVLALSSVCPINVRQEIEKDKEKETDKEKEGIEPPAAPSPKPVRHKYGEYSNVLLTDEEMDKLKAEFPDWQARIERLSSYMASTGKSYKNHLATIRNWARKDAEQPKRDERGGNVFLEMLNEERGL
jgi:predicted phage replisome organizer